MINRFFKGSEFSRNVLTLITGASIAQAIPIAISPILTRIYTPEDFGILSLFATISAVFGSIVNGRYELAIMLPKKDSDAINLLVLGFAICAVISFLLGFIVFFLNENIRNLLGNQEIEFWLYFVPVAVFLTGVFNLLNYYNVRNKYYKDIRNAAVSKSIVGAASQLSIGVLKGGVVGLITGQLLSQLVANSRLIKNLGRKKIAVSVNKIKIIALAKKYKDFPRFTLWAGLFNTLSQNINNVIISMFYGLSTLGYYSFTERVLGMPASLIGSAIGKVYFQEASKEQQETGSAYNSFISASKKLVLIGLPFYFVLYFVVEDIFYYVFGSDWLVAGSYAKIMVPFFMVRFVVSPLTVTNQINKKNKLGMIWQLGLLGLYLTVIYLSDYLELSFEEFLNFLVVVLSVYYMFFYILIYSHVRIRG
ncbi:oligosaccharide flippase family protein [Amphritea sp. 1_MG-2023]|uniref:lipopolysaccharide biosynthesis protein n=1 Tax=Amphritea sp. 1_MG-2023 TaxID=3062670 RepID=UPI0026E412E2|nr:oligosaccharide flippase family protein [Amphritea sp. 1_MG-2023]MDO6563999.1 oligosaccharide flippase family protein [Amphritea sp. 1_MG-2023]